MTPALIVHLIAQKKKLVRSAKQMMFAVAQSAREGVTEKRK